MSELIISSSDIRNYIRDAQLGSQVGVIPCPPSAVGTEAATVTFTQGPMGGVSFTNRFVLIDPSIDNAAFLTELYALLRSKSIPSGYRERDAMRYFDIFVVAHESVFRETVQAFFAGAPHVVTYFDPIISTEMDSFKSDL